MDTLALMSTAVLGIATFVLQARVAKNAEAGQKDLEQARVEQERGRELASVQLERVRSQMGDVYRPAIVMLLQTDACAVYMQHELCFELKDTWGHEFVRPFSLWPHLEVHTRDFSPKWFATIKGSPYKKYSPADIALLEDPAKRQIYIEAHAGCIAQRYREVAAILETKSALMENPPASYLDGVFPNGVADWFKFSSGTLSQPMFDMAAFAHAWVPLERRWESGGASATRCTRPHHCVLLGGNWATADLWAQLADFSRMQPVQPNPELIVRMIFAKMISAAGAKEAELQGASSVMRRNAVVEAAQGET
jgi:hypothetical protein